MRKFDVLIVGSGHAGAQAAIALRQNRFTGSIALFGEERELPYERPPLSKEYLSGDKAFERLLIRPAAFWEERGISLAPGRCVMEVDPAAHEVRTADGACFGYGALIWAAGGRPRRLTCAGGDLAGVHSIRTRADVDALAAELPAVGRVAVIGGGYIGLEAAAVLTKLGKKAVVLEAAPRVLARVAGEPLSRFFEAQHRAHGVEIRLDAQVGRLTGTDRVSGVRLAGGEEIASDLAIVGIGVIPAVEPLLSAGAAGQDGVDVDAKCRTSLSDVFAIGDCARHCNRFGSDAAIRLESVQNANDQASVVAKALTGQEARYEAVPWFWSNQYGLRLQTIGLSAGHHQAVLRGEPSEAGFSVVYLRDRKVIALDCVNATKDYVHGRKLVLDCAEIDPSRLADPNTPLNEMA